MPRSRRKAKVREDIDVAFFNGEAFDSPGDEASVKLDAAPPIHMTGEGGVNDGTSYGRVDVPSPPTIVDVDGDTPVLIRCKRGVWRVLISSVGHPFLRKEPDEQ